MDNKIILIADDHPLVIKSLTILLLEIDKDLTIVAVDNTRDLTTQYFKLKPKNLIIDLSLNDGFALNTLGQILLLDKTVNVMIYTVASAKMYLLKLFKMGIHCFLNKNNTEEELIIALNKFLKNEYYICSNMLPILLSNTNNANHTENQFKILSSNEMIVMEYLINGLSPKAISIKMNIKQNTVTTYKKRAFEKLNVSNLLELKEIYESNF